MPSKPDNIASAVVLRPARVTDLPAIYRGELGYIRQWEPQHEHSWQMAAERHLVQWVENFEQLTVACLEDQLVGYSLWADEMGYAQLCTLHVQRGVSAQGDRPGGGRCLCRGGEAGGVHCLEPARAQR
mgnify:FL=1